MSVLFVSKKLTHARRKKFGFFSLLIYILLLASCTQLPTYPATPTTPTEPKQNLRPAGSPDIVILGFAGRNCPGGCDAPFSNKAYLDDVENQTLQGLKAAFESMGYKTEYESYAARITRYINYNSDDGY